MKHGPTAKPRHRLRSGRTGSAHGKKTPPLSCGYCVLGLVAVLGSHCVRCGKYLGR